MRSGYKKAIALLLALILAVLTAACGAPAQKAENDYPTPEEPLTIKWGLAVSMESQGGVIAQKISDQIKEATGGAVLIEIYPSNQLGNQAALWEGILSGTIDMANVNSTSLANTIPEFEVFSLPFTFKNIESLWAVMGKSEFWEKFSEIAEEKNVVLLGPTAVYTRGFVTKEKVVLPEDLSSMKLRVSSGHTSADAFSSWGISMTTLAINEVYTALQQGVIDGLDQDASGALDMKFFEQAPYFLDTFHSINCSPSVIRADLWNRMSPEQQQAFRAAYSLIAEEAVEVFYQQREINTQRALDMGVTITTLTPEQKQVWIDAVTWMYSDYPYIDSDFESWYMGFVEANAVESDRF